MELLQMISTRKTGRSICPANIRINYINSMEQSPSWEPINRSTSHGSMLSSYCSVYSSIPRPVLSQLDTFPNALLYFLQTNINTIVTSEPNNSQFVPPLHIFRPKSGIKSSLPISITRHTIPLFLAIWTYTLFHSSWLSERNSIERAGHSGRAVFARSNAGVMSSYPTHGMNIWCVYVFILCLCCPVFR
jgi:hypothetical protein